MKHNFIRVILISVCLIFSIVHAYQSSSPENASVEIVGIEDGEVYKSPINIEFVINNMEVVPAGTKKKNSGHHHLLLNLENMPNLKAPLPSTQNIIHFGKAQKSTKLELKEGKHTIQLLFADHLHIPHDPPVLSKKISIIIKK
ncbi:MAG: DUF4399 domain-containing protein [Pseudomonadota bacterium]|nr:DUF4399 domain-containing protein [Pseudomonadota bacterium]|tara:strand:+ start:6775 stop:7203 length:429 start_codon:yes stop_codon:yes gene_type:complete